MFLLVLLPNWWFVDARGGLLVEPVGKPKAPMYPRAKISTALIGNRGKQQA